MADDSLQLQVRRLVDEALQTFDSPGVTTSSLVRKAQRIAALRHDYGMQIGLIQQTNDAAADYEANRTGPMPGVVKARTQLATLLGAAEAEREVERQYESFIRIRHIKGGQLSGLSVSQLEDNLAALERAYEDEEPSPNLTPIDAAFAADRASKARAKLLPGLQWHRAVLGKIRQFVYDYLVSVEEDLLAGKSDSDIFERAKLYINEALGKYAPEALEIFVAAQDSVSSGSREDYAHALLSCRRLIKALADAVYPATGEAVEGVDGTEREMVDDRYKNRLTEYVRNKVEGTRQRQAVLQIVGDLSSRLNALDGLANKGVHADVTQAEAETCVVWTYMLAGDIVRIADGTSALLIDTD